MVLEPARTLLLHVRVQFVRLFAAILHGAQLEPYPETFASIEETPDTTGQSGGGARTSLLGHRLQDCFGLATNSHILKHASLAAKVRVCPSRRIGRPQGPEPSTEHLGLGVWAAWLEINPLMSYRTPTTLAVPVAYRRA